MKKILFIFSFAIVLFVLYFCGDANQLVKAEDTISKQLEINAIDNIKAYNDSFNKIYSYYSAVQDWKFKKITDGADKHVIKIEDMSGGTQNLASESYDYGHNTLYLTPSDEVTFFVEVEDSGLYQLYFDYYVLPKTRLMPRLGLSINDEIQYSEMNNLEIAVNWALETEKKYDRYGDELTPKSELQQKWNYQVGLIEPNRFFAEPLKFKLNEGLNEIKININEGYLLLGDISIENKNASIPSYEQYTKQVNKEKESLKTKIKIEAEDVSYKSRQSIRAKYMRDPKVTPYEYKNRVLNVLDGYSFGEAGDEVTYTFEVKESGYYNLALKYYQNTNNGLPSHRRIYIDHVVPFKELESYRFDYQTSWKNEVLNVDGQPFDIYLTKGIHTLTIAVDNTKIRDIYYDLLNILTKMRGISNDVNKLTGGLSDKDRKWKITTYMPNLVSDLEEINEKLTLVSKELEEYSGQDNLPAIQALTIAKKLIHQFIEDPNDLPAYMNKFDEGESSAYGRINTILPLLLYSPLHLDKMYFYNDAELPNARANIFVRSFEGVKAFFYSFFDPKYNETSEVDDETIEIWVNKSRLYVEIMQRMIDEEFTPETGIKVQLSLLPDENKIILSNAAGTTPDGVIGVSNGRPFELALRGVIEDFRQYEGFYELAEQYNPSTFVPYIYADGVYAIPETQDVKLLFYRKDILEQLNVEPPQTWEEVISLTPVLQKYDMNFFIPIGGDNSFKGFDTTTPFIYQYGGQLYDQETMKTVINKNEAFDAFELMTDLYTIYNLPVTTSNFYQHFRNGTIPIGISDANMYIQLKYAAPELAGQWGIMPIPGKENEEGVIERWDPTYGASSIIFKDSKKKEATWDLIKWWSESETQADFSYEIQSTLGDRFLYMSANIEGFKESAWPSDSKDVVLEQWNWIQATGKVPGDYMLEREISNAWNRVIFEGVNARLSIDQSIMIIDRELHRKLQEFGYVDEDGNIIKPYRIPTIENVESWVRKEDETQN